MSFSQVIGASSAIRPGVVTSSTRPSVPFDGQLIYETDTDRLAQYNGSAWITQNGLQLIKTQTIGSAVSSVTVTGAFSATYDNYKIVINGGVASTSNVLLCQLGSTTTGYYYGTMESTFAAGTAGTNFGSNTANFRCGAGETAAAGGAFDLFQPFLADETWATGQYGVLRTTGSAVAFSAFLNNTTSYTDFTILTTTGTLTGGTIRVYGYANN